MFCNWKRALGAAWVGLIAAAAVAPAIAQVDWVATLNAAAVETALGGANIATTADGSIVSAGMVMTTESNRVRVARVSAAGAVQWVRWANGGTAATPTPLWAHPDNSVTVAYQDPSSSNWCLENFSAAGDTRFRDCPSFLYAYYNDFRITLAADGDFYLAYGSYQRTVRKVSPLGVLRWTRTETTNSPSIPAAQGVDSSGHYFEAIGTRLVAWSGLDGSKITDTTLAGSGFVLNSFSPLSRANRDVVLIRARAITSNAMTATVTRSSMSGAVVWTRDLVFPGYGPDDRLRLVAADSDATYVIRTAAIDGDSHVAKISAAGALLWQKHYARVRRITDYGNVLTAIRSDVTVATNSNDSFLFPISALDGSLGTPMIYTRPDLFAPNEWFATSNGVLATYQGSNPFASLTAYPTTLVASTIFVGLDTPGNRWVVTANARPTSSVQQSDCLMPRLARSSPSSWWARTQAGVQSASLATWIKRDAATGVASGQTTPAVPVCGSPVTQDGGQIIASTSIYDRVRKVDATGTQVWITAGTLYPMTYGTQPVVSVAPSGETTYAAASVLGRVSATGSPVFEVETGRSYPRYLATDSANNAWLVSGYSGSDGYVSKVSPAGALQWSVAIDVPSCSDAVMAARLTASDEMLIATQSCGEGRLFKLNGAGQIVWQRLLSGTSQRPSVMLPALQVDAAGNIYAGGCMANSTPTNTGANGYSVIASWTNAGTERWTAITDLIAGASECVSSIVVDGSGNVFAASSSSDASKAPVLWALNSSGLERWRHRGVLASPVAASTELALESGGKMVALGEAPPSSLSNRESSLRRIDPAMIGSSLQLKFLQVPTPSASYRTPFIVRVGLRTAADAAATATTAIQVTLGALTGTGSLGGTLGCTITVGSSECTISDLLYDMVESGVSLLASADGFAATTSGQFQVVAAATATLLTDLNPGPHAAFTTVRVRATIQAPLPAATQTVSGSLGGPTLASGQSSSSCVYQNDVGALPVTTCDFLAQTASNPITASFYSYGSNYLSSSATPLTLVVTKVTPTLQVSLDPANTLVSGDTVRLRVSLMTPNAINVSGFVAANSISLPSGSCTSLNSAGTMLNGYLGSYWSCVLPAAAPGSQSVNISFLGSGDLLPTGPTAITFTTTTGAVVRGSTYLQSGATVCTTTPGASCSVLANGYGWQCVGAAGSDFDVFFIPGTFNSSFVYADTPLRFRNVTGVVNAAGGANATYVSTACAMDVDGDGARLAMTDGVLILRRMLGMTGAALTNGATHACVPRTAVGISAAINLTYYDVDGDGQTLPETDGLILLRALLGFRGDALIADAIGTNATRKTATDVRNFLVGSCYLPIN